MNDVLNWARFILDCAKAGLDIDESRITWALRVTGDLIDSQKKKKKTN